MSDLLFDSFGGLFGDPQNAHGDCENPFVYAWPESTDADDQEKFLHNPSKKDIKLTLANSDGSNGTMYGKRQFKCQI